jgi:hypothetical protein
MKSRSAELGGVADDGSDFADCHAQQGTNPHACTFSKKASLEARRQQVYCRSRGLGRSGS